MDIMEIKKYLKAHKITYKQLAEMSGVPESTLKNIFGGFTSNPRMDTIEAIERALGINEKSSPAEQESLKVPDSLKPYQFAFFEGMDGLSEESVKDILKYVDYVKSKENKEKK